MASGVVRPGTIAVEHHADGVDVLRLFGEHDVATAGLLHDAVERAVGSGRGVVVSLEEAEFIDSAVVNALFRGDRLLRASDRRLALHVASASMVKRILDVAGIASALPCSSELATALAVAASRGK